MSGQASAFVVGSHAYDPRPDEGSSRQSGRRQSLWRT